MAGKAPPGATLVAALKDFHATPGKYALGAREPRVLFEHQGMVLQLAAGRKPDGFTDVDATIQQAALRFVQMVMLRPGADHYTLLGLQRPLDAEQLREHYRLLIRLTHPDYAGAQADWANDVAARVNIAHDTLADSGRRQAYDASLNRAAQAPRAPHTVRPAARPQNGRRAANEVPAMRVTRLLDGRMVTGLAVAGVLAAVLLWPAGEDPSVQLVARSNPKPSPALAIPATTLATEDSTVLVSVTTASASPETAVPLAPAGDIRAADTGVAFGAGTAAEKAPPLPNAPNQATLGSPAPLPPRVDTVDPSVAMVESPPAPTVQNAAPHAPQRGLSYTWSAPPPQPAHYSPATPTPPATSRPVTAAEMQRLQPLLGELILLMESGQQERLRTWVGKRIRRPEVADSVADAYARALGSARIAGIGKVSFQGQSVADVQVVDGTVELRLAEGDQPPVTRDVRLRAHFLVGQGKGPMLSQLDLLQP